jgi:hypothetical protein
MKKNAHRGFISQPVVGLLVGLSVCGCSGVGLVYLRHQISVTANANRLAEARIAAVERHCAETITAMEGELGPDVLRRRNTEWRLGLQPAVEGQVSDITEDPVMRLAARRNRDLFNDGLPPVSVRVALKD